MNDLVCLYQMMMMKIKEFLSTDLKLDIRSWSSGLVLKALDSQSRDPGFRSGSSFRGRSNEYQELLGT